MTPSPICRYRISKCLFHLCSPELWSQKTRAGLCRIPLRGSHLSAFQPGSQRRGISVCPPSDAYFCRSLRTAIVAAGVEYLRVEGSFYWGIGILFLLYGFYRAVKKPMMSIVLTVISLGLRVALALHSVFRSVSWRHRHLDVRSHRLGRGGSHGTPLLPPLQENPSAGGELPLLRNRFLIPNAEGSSRQPVNKHAGSPAVSQAEDHREDSEQQRRHLHLQQQKADQIGGPDCSR